MQIFCTKNYGIYYFSEILQEKQGLYIDFRMAISTICIIANFSTILPVKTPLALNAFIALVRHLY